MTKTKKITLLIPCYNEEKSIGKLMDDIPYKQLKQQGFSIEVLVIDNNCTDNTAKIAKSKGARVILETKQGKGNAIRTGFQNITKDTDYIVMLDGDNTYKPYEMLRLIEPLDSGFADVIVGSRLEGKMTDNAMTRSHRLANWIFTFLTRTIYYANVTDTCTGYFAWTKKAIDKLNGHITSKGFAIESEMISKMAKLKLRVYSVPITYAPRPKTSGSKLSPVKDGLRIIFMLIRNARWKPENHNDDKNNKNNKNNKAENSKKSNKR